MRLNGIKSERVEVEINPRTAWEAIRALLLHSADIKPFWFLKDDGWFYQDDDHRHGSITESKVAQATPEQVKVYEAISLLEKQMQKVKHA